MRAKFLLTGLLIALLLASGRAVVFAQETETPTPTETETPTETPIPTETPTATANLYLVATLPSSSQAGAIVYTVDIGEAALVGEVGFILILVLVGIGLQIRRSQ